MTEQLDLFGQPITNATPGKKSGVRRNNAARKTTVTTPGESTGERHDEIYINSDGNIIRFVSEIKGIKTYVYVQSNTKLGKEVSFTGIEFDRFVASNKIIPREKFVKANDLR